MGRKAWEYIKDKILPTLIIMLLGGIVSVLLSFKIAEVKIENMSEELDKKASWASVEVTRTFHENRMGRIEEDLDDKADEAIVNMMYDDIKEMKKDIKELLKSKKGS